MTRRIMRHDTERMLQLRVADDGSAYLNDVLVSIHPDRLDYPTLSDGFLKKVAEKAPALQDLVGAVIEEHPIRVLATTHGATQRYQVVGFVALFQLATACKLKLVRVRIIRGPCDLKHLARIDGFLFPMVTARSCDYLSTIGAVVEARKKGQPLLNSKRQEGNLRIGTDEFCLMYGIDEKTFRTISKRKEQSPAALPERARGHVQPPDKPASDTATEATRMSPPGGTISEGTAEDEGPRHADVRPPAPPSRKSHAIDRSHEALGDNSANDIHSPDVHSPRSGGTRELPKRGPSFGRPGAISEDLTLTTANGTDVKRRGIKTSRASRRSREWEQLTLLPSNPDADDATPSAT